MWHEYVNISVISLNFYLTYKTYQNLPIATAGFKWQLIKIYFNLSYVHCIKSASIQLSGLLLCSSISVNFSFLTISWCNSVCGKFFMNSIFESAQICNLFLNHANSVPYKMSRIIEIYFVYNNVLWYAKVQQ